MEEIIVEPRLTPLCACGASDWTVHQNIERDSKLIRVDGMGDLLVETPDPITYAQTVRLICNKCNKSYAVQHGIDAWYENGGEDGFGFAERVKND